MVDTIYDSVRFSMPDGFVLGADPGMKGCAVILDARHSVAPIELRWEKYTELEWLQLMTALSCHSRCHYALLEKVQPMPRDKGSGGVAMFKLGNAFGAMRMSFLAAGMPVHLVSPREWMTQMRVRSKKHDSKGIRDKAQQLFPNATRTPTCDTGDAYLLAELAYQRWKGGDHVAVD